MRGMFFRSSLAFLCALSFTTFEGTLSAQSEVLAEDAKRRLAELDRAAPPSRLQLLASVPGSQASFVVRVRAIFTGHTRKADQIVFLDLRDAKTVSASLREGDDQPRLPEFVPDTEGRLSVLIEEPGNYQLTLDLEVPLTSRGSELGYELHVPGSAITRLIQEPIARVSSFQLSTQIDADAPVEKQLLTADQLKPGEGDDAGHALGVRRIIGLSWQMPDPPATVPGPAPASPGRARVDVEVRVFAEDVRTVATLRLGGPPKEWRVLAPSDANLTVEPAPLEPLTPSEGTPPMPERFASEPRVVPPKGKPSAVPGVWLIQFDEAPKADFLVNVAVPARPLPDKGAPRTPIPIGPIEVQDVFPQAGEFVVLAPPNLRVDVDHPVSVQRVADPPRGLADRPGLAALLPMRFRYAAPPRDSKGKPVPPLTLAIRPLAGRILSQTSHRLELGQEGWHLITEIRLKPIRTEVGHVDLWIPSSLQNLRAESPDPSLTDSGFVQDDAPDKNENGLRRRIQFDRARPESVTLHLRGMFPLKLTDRSIRLELPRVQDTFEQGGRVTAEVPPGIELRGVVREWADGRVARLPFPLIESSAREPIEKPRTGSLNGLFEAILNRAAAEADLSWGPKSEETEVDSTIDLYLQQGQAEIHHRFLFPGGRPRILRLVGGKDLQGLRQGIGQGQLTSLSAGEWAIFWETPEGATVTRSAHELELIYSFPLSEQGGILELPILRPAAARGEVRVRVWRGGAGLRPQLASSSMHHWQARPTEVVAGERGLPSMVLVGTLNSVEEPLSLDLTPDDTGSRPAVRVERALILASDDGADRQTYSAYFRLSHWEGDTIAVELPGGVALRHPVFTLHGRQADVGASPKGSFLVRVGKCDLQPRESAILSVRYQVDRSALGGTISRWSGWQVRFEPPRLPGAAFDLPTLWQIGMPSGDVPIYFGEGVTFRSRLTWHNGLLRSEAGRNEKDVIAWFTEGLNDTHGSAVDFTTVPWDEDAAMLSAHQADPDAIRFTVVGRPWWLVCSSLTVLVVGLLLWRLPSWLFWGSVCLGGVTLGALALGWQQAAGQLLCGTQIGVEVLTIVLVVRWLLRRRHRRRLVFMSGFRRTPMNGRGTTDSSLNGKRRSRELPETGPISPLIPGSSTDGSPSPWSTDLPDEH